MNFNYEIRIEPDCPCDDECEGCFGDDETKWPCGGDHTYDVEVDAEPGSPGNRRGHPDTWEEDDHGYFDILSVKDEHGRRMDEKWIADHRDDIEAGFDKRIKELKEDWDIERAEAHLDWNED